jgi:hypothetical protein
MLLYHVQIQYLIEIWPFAKQIHALIIIYSFINILRLFSKCKQIWKFAKKD